MTKRSAEATASRLRSVACLCAAWLFLGAAACATSSASSGGKQVDPAPEPAPKTRTKPISGSDPQSASPLESPPIADPGQRLAFDVANIVDALKSSPDCDKADEAGAAYVKQHLEAMRATVREIKHRAEAQSDEDNKKYFAVVMKLLEELRPGAEAEMDGFEKRCPDSHVLDRAFEQLDKE